jgi:hypothetical protein
LNERQATKKKRCKETEKIQETKKKGKKTDGGYNRLWIHKSNKAAMGTMNFLELLQQTSITSTGEENNKTFAIPCHPDLPRVLAFARSLGCWHCI